MRRAGLLALLSFGCTEGAFIEGSSLDPIIGGQPSMSGEYPETGAILTVYDFGGGQMFGSLTCTGTLIAPDVVMTAGHCTVDFFQGMAPFKNYFTFELDVAYFGQTSLDLPVDAIEFHAPLIAHPMFDINSMPPPGLSNYNDVGIGFLQQTFANVPGVVADTQDALTLTVGDNVAIVGYGQTTAASMAAGVKNQAFTIINEINQHEMQIGAVPPGDPQKCHGDSGGPTFIDINDGRAPLRRVIGITSRAYDESDCNVGGVDTRADAFRSWYDQEMRDACTSGLRPGSVCANGGGLPLPGGVLPPIDAGVTDSGGGVDSGPRDGGNPGDGGPPGQDASQVADASTGADGGPGKDVSTGGGGGGGSGRRRDGCSCEAKAEGKETSSLLLLALLGLMGFRRGGGAASRRGGKGKLEKEAQTLARGPC